MAIFVVNFVEERGALQETIINIIIIHLMIDITNPKA
jgi:hypothetical protein